MTEKITLRNYQTECIEKIHEVFKKENAQLIQLPTGSGKTFIFLNYLKNYSKTGLIICPNKELQYQIWEWGKFFLGENSISLGIPRNKKKEFPYYVVTAASLNFTTNLEFLCWQEFKTIIIDEAHRAQSKTYTDFLYAYDAHYEPDLLGCTATPERLDKKDLMEIFNLISFDMTLLDMIEKGYLSDIIGYRIKTNSKIKTRNYLSSGDFMPIDLKQLDTESRNEILLKTYMDNCKDKKTLIFCLSVDHAKKIAKILQDENIAAEAIYGDMGIKKRLAILDRYHRGETKVLTNCQLLTEGFDEPSIEALIIARPTKSKTLYCQMLGRGVRKTATKDLCYLYELTDNNHNICTFGSATDAEQIRAYEYKNGIKLSELGKELNKLSIEDVVIKKERFDIFPKNTNIFESIMNCIEPTDVQKKLLEKIDENIITFHPSMLEAAFLIWKQKKLIEMRANGIN